MFVLSPSYRLGTFEKSGNWAAAEVETKRSNVICKLENFTSRFYKYTRKTVYDVTFI